MKKIDNNFLHKVINRQLISPTLLLLRLERKEVDFIPGQYFYLGLLRNKQSRAYSVFSGINDPWIDFLIHRVDNGEFSPMLFNLRENDKVFLDGPKGYFRLPPDRTQKKIVFIATGSGIAPFHSMVTSYPDLDYALLYGVKTAKEAVGVENFSPERRFLVTSREDNPDTGGRITDYLDRVIFDHAVYYLCGGNNMIKKVTEVLLSRGVASQDIKTEFFY